MEIGFSRAEIVIESKPTETINTEWIRFEKI